MRHQVTDLQFAFGRLKIPDSAGESYELIIVSEDSSQDEHYPYVPAQCVRIYSRESLLRLKELLENV